MSWLVDTHVISELCRKTPNARVAGWLVDHQDALFVSVLTLGELETGLAMAQDATRKIRLERWIRHEIPDWFEGRILPVDHRIAVRWGRVAAALRGPIPTVDSLLAATALIHGLTVITRNIADFERT